MKKNKRNDRENIKILDMLIKDIFKKQKTKNKIFFSLNSSKLYLENKLKNSLKRVRDQRCFGYIKALVGIYDKEKTLLEEHRDQGNLKVRLIRNYNFNDELIIINTAGGLTSGDINIHYVKVLDNIKLNITTQSMEKVYNCKNFFAYNFTNISVGTNSYVAWLPLETIFFNGGKLRRRINIELQKKSNFLGVETIIFGRKAMGEVVNRGYLDDAWQIYQNNKLIYSDFNRINGNISKKLSNALVMQGNNIFCNIVFIGKKIKTYKRKILIYISNSECFAGVSIVNDVLLLKVIVKDIIEVRNFLDNLIMIFDGNFNLPKLWSS